MSEPVVVGVDIGATKILVGAVTQAGEILSSRRFKIDHGSRETTLRSIETALGDFMRELDGEAPRAIGVGAVGMTDPKAGTWFEAMNLPIKDPVPLAGALRDRYGIPVALDNDVHAATLAEMRWGIGKESNDFIYLNVGTGIAAGLVFNGQLLRGSGNYAGELGHMVVQPDGPLCLCGRRGCLELIASGGGMLDRVKERLVNFPDSTLDSQSESLTSHLIFRAADSGDPLAIEVTNNAVEALSSAMTGLVNLLNPEWITYGGGTLSDGWLMQRVQVNIEAGAMVMTRKSLKGIIPSRLNPDNVGLLGAACLALNLNSSSRGME